MPQLSCLLIGEETLVISCGDALLARGHTVAGVVSGNDKVRAWARDAGLAQAARLRDLPPSAGAPPVDWLFSIANPGAIPEAARAMARKGTINFQDGPLPDCAGPHTPAWALMAGASYCLTDNILLDAGYRFTRVNGGRMFEYAPVAGPGFDEGIDVHEVRGGLRYQFGGSSRCAPPPAYEPIPVEPPVYK